MAEVEVRLIELERVTYSYPQRAGPALREVSLSISEGDFVLVAGRSGSGKSTFLRCLNGLVPHFYGGSFAGRVMVDGWNTRTTRPEQLATKVGFVFQDPETQFVTDRLEDEIAFGLENAGMPPMEMKRRVAELMERFELGRLRDRPIHTYSGGEMQRVALASVLALRPATLALDEPTSQLDREGAEALLSLVAELREALGLRVLIAEHRVERLLPVVSRVIRFEGGSVVGWLGGWDGGGSGYETDQRIDAGVVVSGNPGGEAVNEWKTNKRMGGVSGNGYETDKRIPGEQGSKGACFARGPGSGLEDALHAVNEFETNKRITSASGEVGSGGEEMLGSGLESKTVEVLKVEDVSYSYGNVPALDDVSFSLEPGQLLALTGRNGSGKTTLLKCLVGLLRPARGEIRVGGETIAGKSVAEVAKCVGYVPQNPSALLFADTVRDELMFTLRNHGLAEKPPIAPDELLESLGLAGLAEMFPRDLSSGQRQRVALAAVLVTRPGLILLDEPTRGMDVGAKEALAGLLRGWQARGAAVILATHDVDFALRHADRLLKLEKGRMEEWEVVK